MIIILTNRPWLLLLFVSKLISISVEIPLGTFLNLVSDISEKKNQKISTKRATNFTKKAFYRGLRRYRIQDVIQDGGHLTATILEPISRQKNRFYFGSNRLGI